MHASVQVHRCLRKWEKVEWSAEVETSQASKALARQLENTFASQRKQFFWSRRSFPRESNPIVLEKPKHEYSISARRASRLQARLILNESSPSRLKFFVATVLSID